MCVIVCLPNYNFISISVCVYVCVYMCVYIYSVCVCVRAHAYALALWEVYLCTPLVYICVDYCISMILMQLFFASLL